MTIAARSIEPGVRTSASSIALSVEDAARPAKSLALSTKDVTVETGIGLNALYDAIRTGALKARAENNHPARRS